MVKKNTGELEKELAACGDIGAWLKENAGEQGLLPTAEYLNGLLEAKGLVRSDVIARSGINEIYAYQIFSGRRNPSREKLLCLAIAMGLTGEETQAMLQRCGQPKLYPRDRRDSLLLFALGKGLSVLETNEVLFDHKEATLG